MITPLFQWLPFSGIFMKLPCRIHQLALTKKMQAKIPHFKGVAIRKHEKTQ